MFLIAVTKNEISHNLRFSNIEEFKSNSAKMTIVTDNFLTKFITEKDGFSVIESPITLSHDSKRNVFSQVKYDQDNKVINIFRSAVSGRPIYYCINNEGDFFCSTHIHMLRDAGVLIEENTKVLPEFFVYRIVMPPGTLYKNIKQLSIGDQLCIKIKDGKCMFQSLGQHHFPTQDKNIHSINKSAKKILNLLLQSIETLDDCKDNIALLLSGGLDSSILCRICQEIFKINDSYSTGYPFEHPDLNLEKSYALSAGEVLGLNHDYYQATTEEYLRGFLEAIYLAETPLHHLQSICLHLLYKQKIPKNKTILIEGWGAGGSFGNFRNYLFLKDKLIFKLLSKKMFHRGLKIIPKIIGKGEQTSELLIKSSLDLPLNDPDNPIWSFHAYGSKKWVCDHLKVSEKDIISNQYDSIERFENRSIYDITALYSLLGDEDITLSILSKIGEGNRKIHYFPFYDLNVLNSVFLIPWKLKMRRPENILRKSIARQCGIPKFIINRPKLGFGIRSNTWSKKGGIFEPLVPLASRVFDEKQIRKMQSTEPKKAMTFWNMLNYSIWKRLCINNESVDVLLEEINETI